MHLSKETHKYHVRHVAKTASMVGAAVGGPCAGPGALVRPGQRLQRCGPVAPRAAPLAAGGARGRGVARGWGGWVRVFADGRHVM